MIPKTIHLHRGATTVAGPLRERESWHRHHPGWTIREWGDADLRAFVAEREAAFLPIFDAHGTDGSRRDAARYVILKHAGGLCVGPGVECLRPIDPLLAGAEAAVGLQPRPDAALAAGQRLAPALVAGRAGHPFWDAVLEVLAATDDPRAMGAVALTRAYADFADKASVRLLPSETVSPVDRAQARSGSLFDIVRWERATRTAATLDHWIASPSEPWPAVPQRFDTSISGPPGAAVYALEAEPLVSCLMVTRDRPELAWLAVGCFLRQTYGNKELVVIDDGRDDALARRLSGLAGVRHFGPDGLPPSIGRARNRALAAAAGPLVCQWDDDDLCDPLRLDVQVAALRSSGARACLLDRWLIWWPESMRVAVSTRRLWEGSLLCEKAALGRYPDLQRGEDTPVVERLARDARIVLVDAPRLYLYVAHGRNTFSPHHFEAHWAAAAHRFEGERGLAVIRELEHRLPLSDYAAARPSVAVSRQPPSRPRRDIGQDVFETYRRNARSLADRRDYGSADRIFEGLRIQWPERPEGLHGLASTAGLRGDWIAAIARWEELAVLFPSYAPGLLGRAGALTELGRYDEAEDAYRSAADHPTARNEALLGLARNAQQACRWSDASARWDEILTRQPGHPAAHFGRVRALLALGAVDAAEHHVASRCAALDVEDRLILRCMLLQKRQDTEGVIALLDPHPDIMRRNVTLRMARLNADRSRGDIAAIALGGRPGTDGTAEARDDEAAVAQATAIAHSADDSEGGRKALVAYWRRFGVAGLSQDLLSPVAAAVLDQEGRSAAAALLDAVRAIPLRDARAVKLRLLEVFERLRLAPGPGVESLLRRTADACDPRMPSGHWREAVYRIVNSVERIATSYPGAMLDTAWMEGSARDVLDDVVTAIRAKRAFSLIRLGDGEGNFLPYPAAHAGHVGPDRDATQCIWWGRPRLSPDEAEALARALADSVRSADVVGIPDLSRLCYSLPVPTPADLFQSWHDFRGQLAVLHNVLDDAGRADAERLFGRGQRLTSCHIHGDFAAFGLYGPLFAAAGSVSVVACHPALPERMRALFGVAVRRFIPIPHERKAQSAFGYETRGEHWPDRFEELRRDLDVTELGEVFIVAAGFLGKIYCDWIKQKGGIALDVGSVVDHWCGFSTRAPFFVERYRGRRGRPAEARSATPAESGDIKVGASVSGQSLRIRRAGTGLSAWIGSATLPGIDLHGSFSESTGLAMGARDLAAALAAAGMDHRTLDIGRPVSGAAYPINLISSNPYVLRRRENWRPHGSLDPDAMAKGFNIAVWAWESATTAPWRWDQVRFLFDDIWVPSRFTRHCLERTMGIDAFVVPHAIEVGTPALSREQLGIPRDAFLLCFVFDGASNPQRKNAAGVIRAFRRAFPDGGAVLVVKARGVSRSMLDEITTAAEGHPDVHLRLGEESRADVLNLIGCCDAYVSLHRAEGFGLTIAEAMALGKPVIATDYSGSTDFLDESTGYPVSYRLVTTDRRHDDYGAGTVWAEPDLDHAARLMRLVRDDPAAARVKGEAAAQRMRDRYSAAAIGGIVRGRIETLVARSAEKAASPAARSTATIRPKARPRVLVLTPVRDAAPHLPSYRRALEALDHPKDRIALAFLEGDSRDGSAALLEDWLPDLRSRYARVDLIRHSRGFTFEGPRWQASLQLQRRSGLAAIRNRLLQAALGDEDWVLWIDADVIAYPPDTLDRLLATGRDIVTPHCVRRPAGPSFDLNTFLSTEASLDGERRFLQDGIVQAPKGAGRRYLDSCRGTDLVKVDSVGGTMLLVRADLHREGLVFPAYSHRGYIETEGLAMVAHDLGIQCWGMPDLEIIHADV